MRISRHLQVILYFTLAFALTPAARAAVSSVPDDLAIRAALYDFHQGNYLSALITYPESDASPEAQLLRAQTLAQFGLLDSAKKILETLVRDNGGKLRAEAAFELGRIDYRMGRYGDAIDAFKRINGLDKRLLPIYRRYNAAAMLAQGDLTEAAKVLSKIEDSVWAGYAYQNLAYEYYKKDTDPSRALISMRVAEALSGVTSKDSSEAEVRELNSRIHLAAGQMSLDSLDYEKAITFLNKVSVDGASAAQALYLHGLAHAKAGRFRQAIQSWYRVKKYPLIEDGVSDAFMGLAFAFDKEGYTSKSIRSYLEAISVLDKEVRTLDTVISTVNEIGAVSALLRESSLDRLEWFLADSIATNTPKVSYLIYLISDPDLLQQVERIAEIDVMIDNLSIWQHDLSVFESMLASRVTGFKRGAKSAQSKIGAAQVVRLKQRRDNLLAELTQAEAENNFISVASGELQSQFDRANTLASRVDVIKNAKAVSAQDRDNLTEKIRILNGILVWDAKEQYEQNLQSLRREFFEVDKEIERYEANLNSFATVVSGGPDRFESLLGSTEDKKKQNAAVLTKAKQLLADADKEFTAASLTMLTAKRNQLNNRNETAQQALAHLYERLAMQQYELAERQRKIEEEKRLAEEQARLKLQGKKAAQPAKGAL